jgi:sugar O-acyltransferase (sialic acid O-acetyltransferase NeuD family)
VVTLNRTKPARANASRASGYHPVMTITEQAAGQAVPMSSPHERVVIIGTGETAAIAFEYFRADSPHEVVAFAAERSFITADRWCGLPVAPLEEIALEYPPGQYRAFVAVSYTQLNRLRRRLYSQVKAAGFTCVSYVSSRAMVAPTARIGENAYVQEFVAVQPRCVVGNNVVICSGACVGHGAVIGDDCFTGPHATICGLARIGRGAFIGAGSCVADEVSVAEDCIISAGAAVTKDTVRRQVYVGSPARPVARDSFDSFGVVDGAASGAGASEPVLGRCGQLR